MVDANELTPSFLIAPWAFTTASQCSLTSLKFSDKALEQAYTESTVGSTYPPLDSSLCLQKLLVSLALVACIAVGALEATPVGRAVWCLYISMLAGHLALMKLLPEFYRQKRRLLIIPIKLCLAATLASFVPTFVLKQVHSTAAYAEVLVLGSGLVLQLCTGVCMPVLWRHHVPLALASFCLYDFVMLKPLVDVFMCTAEAVSRTSVLYTALDDAAYTIGGLLMPYPMERPKPATARAQVYIVVLWLQLHLALLVPALYLYHVESRSRCTFMQAQQQEQQQQPEQPMHAQAGSSTNPPNRAHICSPGSSAGAQEHMHAQPVLLACAFMLLLSLMTWNVLHLCINWVMPALDVMGPHPWVASVASKHGLAGACFPAAEPLAA